MSHSRHCTCYDCTRARRSATAARIVALLVGFAFAMLVLSFTGCMRAPRSQSGGGSTVTLGGGVAPTTANIIAPQNPQTPSTTTLEKETVTEYEIPPDETATAGTQGDSAREQPETSPRSAAAQTESRVAGDTVQGASPASNAGRPGAAAPPRIMRQSVTERATTQTGTSQDLAGILKVWGAATATHYKSLLWCLVLGVAAWAAWKREWPLIAAVLGVGAVLSLLVEWWIGPVAAGAAALIWAAYNVARAQLPRT